MLHRPFSHIYVEKEVLNDKYAQALLNKFKNREIIEIDSYKSIFNRPRQSFDAQKYSPKLILAKRRGEFYWQGSEMCPAHGFKRFFHSTLAMNCIFDCAYCYLQGLYPSANLVLFTNVADYFESVEELLGKEPLFLSISYETDLFALESFIPYIRLWHEFSRDKKELLIEARTKCGSISEIEDLVPHESMVLAWSLSPKEIAQQFESGAPSPQKRIEAAKKALALGWKVRLCFDPIIATPNWEKIYPSFIEDVGHEIDFKKLFDVSFGSFRLKKEHFKALSSRQAGSEILDGLASQGREFLYADNTRAQISGEMRKSLSRLIDGSRIYSIE